MATSQMPPFQLGATWYGGRAIDASNLGGAEWEGKILQMETYAPPGSLPDPSVRPRMVKVVRNRSGVNLKPGRVVKFDSTDPYGTSVAGYCFALGDKPCGVVDDLIPPAGVPNNDLFYVIVSGPCRVVQPHTSNSSVVVGDILSVTAGGAASAVDDLGGRVLKQDLTGAAATLGNNILGMVGYAAETNNTVDAMFKAVISMLQYIR
jgi:hypothetical protein